MATGVRIDYSAGPANALPDQAQQKIVTANSAANTGLTTTMAPDAGRQAWLAGVSVTATGPTVGGPVVATIQIANLFGGTGSLFFTISVPAGPAVMVPFVINFNPPLQGNGLGVGPNCILPALGSGGAGIWTCNLWGYES